MNRLVPVTQIDWALSDHSRRPTMNPRLTLLGLVAVLVSAVVFLDARPGSAQSPSIANCRTRLRVHMNSDSGRTAVIIGASSGIGEALAHQLNREGWCLGLLARRLDRLEAMRQSLAPETIVRRMDVTHTTQRRSSRILEKLGGVDLIIISAGAGHNNRDLNVGLDVDTVAVNVLGFMKMA